MVSLVFNLSFVFHLNDTASDHSSLLWPCDWDSTRRPSRFKFLHVWLKHHDFLDIVRQSWVAPMIGRGMRALQQKLVRLKLRLKTWNKDVFDNVSQQVKEAEEDVSQKVLILFLLWSQRRMMQIYAGCLI